MKEPTKESLELISDPNRKAAIWLLILLGLMLITISLLLQDFHLWKNIKSEDMKTFQALVGGLGMGSTSVPAWNYINYDPRLEGADSAITWPIPGGLFCGPDRAATVSYFEEIPVNFLKIKILKQDEK